jgi:hypothetical protein
MNSDNVRFHPFLLSRTVKQILRKMYLILILTVQLFVKTSVKLWPDISGIHNNSDLVNSSNPLNTTDI